ncbi:cytochrome c oxidase assembly protein [Kineosporia rhizophila]|uniref:cytochrome c oxidase assembly protein n=1 Tax=Kineosporia rhizophila TaxID=84633 RepID=UPI001E65508C|nr:cytochrome c oxidase assembly protein [Kineosporia rhizophila]
MHHQGQQIQAGAGGWYEILAIALLLVLAVGYAEALWFSRHRGSWPLHRTALWYAGLACCAATVLGPADHTFTRHMLTHLLLGILAPLLLVLARPITLLLRALPLRPARSLSHLLQTSPLRLLLHPVTAAALNGGGLWLLYGTELYSLMHRSELFYGLVHLHLLLAGYLFTAALVGRDPNPHRSSIGVRSAALVAFMAAHSILAKQLYAFPPEEVTAADARAGAQLMYYAGDAVDVTLIVLLFAGWYAATRPRAPQPPSGQRLSEHLRPANDFEPPQI